MGYIFFAKKGGKNMRTALIPIGIAAAIGVAGIVITNVGGSGVYVPATVEMEAAGGTDEKVQTIDDLETILTSPAALRSGAYYENLVGATSDPQPEKGGSNSFGCIATGNYSLKQGSTTQSYTRTLTIAQNEKGCVYRIEIDMTQSVNSVTTTLKQDVLYAISRHGMFTKYNSYHETNGQVGASISYVNDAAMSHRGAWYTLDLSEAHKKEMSGGIPTTEAAAFRYMSMMTCSQIVSAYQSSLLAGISSNNAFFGQVAALIQANRDQFESGKKNYTLDLRKENGLQLTFDLSNAASPTIVLDEDFTMSSVTEKQHQEIRLYHIDNAKVEIIDSGAGDMFDLFGEAIEKMYRAQAASASN